MFVNAAYKLMIDSDCYLQVFLTFLHSYSRKGQVFLPWKPFTIQFIAYRGVKMVMLQMQVSPENFGCQLMRLEAVITQC